MCDHVSSYYYRNGSKECPETLYFLTFSLCLPFCCSALNRAESDGPQGWVISGEGMPGQLLSFLPADTDNQHYRGIRAIPRITSQGVLCGAIFKVASNADLAHPVLQL
eukprot:1159782-Pelagomonas_calceolata.AAC.7